MIAKPAYYLTALGLAPDFDATREDVSKAYGALAANGLHPDHGGDPELWKLITAAFNEVKAILGKKRGHYINKSDEAWLRAWDALQRPSTRASEPEAAGADKPKASKTTDGFVFEDIEGESKDDRRRRYARTRQQYRYANDPDFAAARKSASLKSHKKGREEAKARKANEAAAAAAS